MGRTVSMAVFMACVAGGHGYSLSADSLNTGLINAQYAVRGAVLNTAMELGKDLLKPDHGHPFDELISCNIGNPQALGQKPPTFNRQVLSMITNTELLEKPHMFLPEAVERAQMYMARNPNGIGAYSNSQGIAVVREEVAAFIAKRDGYPSDPENIFLTNGASEGVRMLMQATIRGGEQRDGILVPIPQYPLYSALTTLFDGEMVGYYMDEDMQDGWKMTDTELQRAYDEAKAKGITTRGIVIINPGNPASGNLPLEGMQAVVRFCVRNQLVLMADEVYQENLYGKLKKQGFTSFKKVVMSMGEEASTLELVSFHSLSKGFMGECGIRGGYFEMHNMDPAVKAMLYKLASISLCSNLMGQISIGLMVNPPAGDGAAAKLHREERDGILGSLERRAQVVAATLNKLEGVTCTPLLSSLYAFPQIRMPPDAIKAAEAAGQEPDLFYCLALLKATGIITVPGSGFKQREGEYHFRMTFLPPEDKMEAVMQRLGDFHGAFMQKYSEARPEL